jgi:1-acyl-sn-glycerol-3-phosphate acyltransferase
MLDGPAAPLPAPVAAAARPPLGALPSPLRGAICGILLVLNTMWWCGLLFVLALVRLVLPWRACRLVLDPWLNRVATAWIAGNSSWMRLTQRTAWDVQGLDGLAYRGWYLVLANHQSWVDIFVLQHLLNRRIPMLKFFLKHELIWVPLLGLAWWALDFPFMRRHSNAVLMKHPEKRLEDVEATRRACAKFALVPTSVMNFVEGTRFTPAKHAAQHSRMRHLLKPKAGGLAMAMNALGDRFDALLDLTIVYPDGPPTFWQFLRGDVRRIVVRAQRRPIPPDVAQGDYAVDSRYRKRVQRWLLVLWHDKDALIDALMGMSGAAAPASALGRDSDAPSDAR